MKNKLKALIVALCVLFSVTLSWAAMELLSATTSGAITFAVNPGYQVYTGTVKFQKNI